MTGSPRRVLQHRETAKACSSTVLRSILALDRLGEAHPHHRGPCGLSSAGPAMTGPPSLVLQHREMAKPCSSTVFWSILSLAGVSEADPRRGGPWGLITSRSGDDGIPKPVLLHRETANPCSSTVFGSILAFCGLGEAHPHHGGPRGLISTVSSDIRVYPDPRLLR